uniref:Uncharacterized protein n=1 Tax=Aegilops tauschii subsp. strangulata TaxID=200361 RepID=A0A453PIG0_AEGTS
VATPPTPDPGEDIAAGALAHDGGSEVGALVERHAALAAGSGERCRDLLRRDADAVRHDRLQLPHAQRRLHGHRAQVHPLLPILAPLPSPPSDRRSREPNRAVQRHTDCKDSWPGQWDISSAGHISVVDSSVSSARLQEA